MATGSLGSTDNRYHVISTNNKILTKLGLSNFTLDGWTATITAMEDSGAIDDLPIESWVQDFRNDLKKENFINFLSGSSNDFTCSKLNDDGSYATKTYSLSDVYSLIIAFEEHTLAAASGNITSKAWLRDNIYPIQSSKEKCLTCDFKWPYEHSDVSYVSVYFQDISKASFERVPALRNPIIAAPARSFTGLLYDHKRVKKDITDNNISYVYPEKRNGEANPESLNVLSAPMRLNYNENIGMWESTQQIVAYLLHDIPPPFNPNFLSVDQTGGYLDDEDDLKKYSNPSEQEYYVSNFTVGLAVPVSCKNNNPYAFTPNFIKDRSGTRMEKITVVNRSTANFNKGQLVLCTLVGSEWLVSEFGAFKEINLPAKTKFWAFQKLMANSDSFFAMYSSRASANSQANGVLVTIGEYLNEFRKGYYKSWLNSHTEDNFPTANNFNSIATLNAPGYADGYKYRDPYYYYTNSSDAPYGADISNNAKINIDEILPEAEGWRLPMFFGPVFPDGYGVIGLRNIGEDEHIPTNGKNLAADEAVYGWGPEFFGQDRYGRQECIEGYLNRIDLYEGSIDLRNQDREPLDANAYAAPSNPARIQFSPLSVEAIIHADNWATEVTDSTDNRDNIKLNINRNPQTYGPYSDATQNQFASIITRNPLHSTPLSTDCSTYNFQPGNNLGFAYDCFVKREASSIPIGVPRTFNSSTDGLNFVGITFAMQRITKSGGGQINFDVINQIGVPGYRSVTPGSVWTGMFTPPVIGQPQVFGNPTWGSTTDLYNSFGTTALHCMVFDAWPIEDTIYDPAYFSVMHFNSRTEDVDFKVPTTTDGFIAVLGSTDQVLDDKENWIYDKIRRGQLLTGNGFQYYRRNLRLSNIPAVIREGTNIVPEYQYENKSNKISFKYSNGSAVWDNDPEGIIGELRGFDMSPDQFSNIITVDGEEYDGFIVEIPSLNDDGDSKILQFRGVVEDTFQIDYGPANHSNGVIRLSSPSNDGNAVVYENRSSSVEVSRNSTNEYDIFYFFHNDITHTIFSDTGVDQIPGYLQYLILTMN